MHGAFEGPISREELLSTLTKHDLILSNQADENDVLTIIGTCTVVQRRPTHDPIPPLPTGTFVCRYSIDFGGSSVPGTVRLTPHQGENDDWPSMEVSDNMGLKRSADVEQSNHSTKRARIDYDLQSTTVVESDAPRASTGPTSSNDQEESESKNNSEGRSFLADSSNGSSSSSSSNRSSPPIKDTDASAISSDDDEISTSSFKSLSDEDEMPQETEGSTTVGNIHVGPEYQAVVPTFDANEPFSRTSRNPTLLWKRNSIRDEDLDEFFGDAARILYTFLESNELLTEDPYTPLPAEQAEAKALSEGQVNSTTISHVSTGSSVSTSRIKLTRECKVEVLMSILLRHDFDTKAALEEIAASPQEVLTIWTPSEKGTFVSAGILLHYSCKDFQSNRFHLREQKDMFDSGFRRYSGSLRMISRQGLAASKTYKDVIDYHYRFKIPDQFRRYQEKKRELAVRMMECIENRRYYESLIPSRSDSAAAKGTGTAVSGKIPNGDEKKQSRDWYV